MSVARASPSRKEAARVFQTEGTIMKIAAALVLAGSMAGCLAHEAGTLDDELATDEIATAESEDSLIVLPPPSDLAVNATVSTSGERRWLWDMTVTPPTGLVLAPGEASFEQFDVHFWTTGIAATYTARGRIAVANTSRTRSATVSAVSARAGGVAAVLTCPALPVVLAPGGSLTCGYRLTLSSGADTTLVTRATQPGRLPAVDLDAVSFTGTTTDVDRVVEATASGHGQITVADANFEDDVHTDYHRQIGPFSVCGPFTSTGVASLRALETPDSTRSGLLTINRSADATGTVACP
jgi:hypothetical protein